MASASDSRGKQSGHASCRVVEDFVNLKVQDISYENLLNHSENLGKTLEKKSWNVDDEVRAGILSVLLAILDHSAYHHQAQLQQTLLHILKNIADGAVKTDVYGILVKAEPQLLMLLKLYAAKPLASEIISILSKIRSAERKASITSQQKCIEALLDTVKRAKPEIQQNALDLVRITISEDMPSPEAIGKYVSELSYFLDTQNMTVKACQIYTEIANKGSDDVINAMLSTACLSDLTKVLSSGSSDESWRAATTEVLHCLCTLASKSRQCVEQLLTKKFRKALCPYMNPTKSTALQLQHAHCLAAHIIIQSNDEMVTDMMKYNMVPKVELIWTAGSEQEGSSLEEVLRRLLQNDVFVSRHLDKCVLDYLLQLSQNGKVSELRELLKILYMLFNETKDDKRSKIQTALESKDCKSKLEDLGHDPDQSVQTLVLRILTFRQKK